MVVTVQAANLLVIALLVGSAAALVEIGRLPNFQHRIAGTLHIQDERTLLIQNFRYDGTGPDVYWYYFRPGVTPDRRGGDGIIIPFSDTQERLTVGRRYRQDENVTITLPEGQTVCDIGTFTIWCQIFSVFFSSIEFPTNLFARRNGQCRVIGLPLPPPVTEATVQPTDVGPRMYDNCQPLDVNLHLSWTIDRANQMAHYRLCGCISLQDGTNQYMGFGLSASQTRTLMFGADPTITWVDDEQGAQAQDYFLSAYLQCRDGVGACPDTLDSSGRCTNDVSDVSGSKMDGIQCVSYSRGFSTTDNGCDLPLDPENEDQYVVWGVGSLGETAFKHFNRATANDPPLFLGRAPQDNCQAPLECQNCDPFEPQQIMALEDATFVAQIGPSGIDRGYVALTGQAGWGITWYINGSLIPELTVQRGRTYTFVVEGGNDSSNLAEFHPFYITDSINGGILLNRDNQSETVYAGFDANNNPIGIGRFCEYVETELAIATLAGCGSVEDYQSYLELECDQGEPAIFTWTPDETTPDLVFYQCANHLNLGWAITVMDDPDPCANRECRVGYQCEIFEATGEPFCTPSCELDNGGCGSGEICNLQHVRCFSPPCAPVVRCLPECPPVCSYEFCTSEKANRRAPCTHPNPHSNCTGTCALTFCHACYNLDRYIDGAPGTCASCDDYDTQGRCFRRWATCIRRAHYTAHGKIRSRDRSESNFFCYEPC